MQDVEAVEAEGAVHDLCGVCHEKGLRSAVIRELLCRDCDTERHEDAGDKPSS